MAAERRCAAVLDRTHDFELAEAHMAGVGLTPRRSEVAEDICDFESGTDHEYRLFRRIRPFVGQQCEPIEWAHDCADHVGGDLRVEHGRV